MACILNCSVPVTEASVESKRTCEACAAMEHGSSKWCEDYVWWHDDPFPCPSYPDSPKANSSEGRGARKSDPLTAVLLNMPAWPIVATLWVTVLRASMGQRLAHAHREGRRCLRK